MMGRDKFLEELGMSPTTDDLNNNELGDETSPETIKAQAMGLQTELDDAEHKGITVNAEPKQSKTELKRAEESLKACACPRCGNIGFGVEVKELPENEFNKKTGKSSNFPIDFSGLFPQKVVRFKDCPNPKCDNVEEVKRK